MPDTRTKGNQLKPVFYFLLLLFLLLFISSFIPEVSIGSFHFKKLDLWNDLQEKEITEIKQTDSSKVLSDSVGEIKIENTYKGVEEYGESNLVYFYRALAKTRSRPVRIAFFGDSFIEGDIFCGPFRDTLQRVFGGSGVGYMPITSAVNQFRTSIIHEFKNWKTYSMVGERNVHSPLSLPGYCFRPLEGNEVTYRPVRNNFVAAKLFYETEQPFSLAVSLNGSVDSVQVNQTGTLKQYTFARTNLQEITFSFPTVDSIRVYGAALEDTVGISVDNLGMRSNPGMGLFLVDEERMSQFNAFRNYKLIILQYGLNVLSENDTSGYQWYGYKMRTLISNLKNIFPETAILLIGVGDRGSNQHGKIVTMPTLLQLRHVQRTTAAQTHIAFWDMFEAMGGENSMVKYTEAQPPLAAKDYTHLTFRGGRKLGGKLAQALLNEKKKYEKKK